MNGTADPIRVLHVDDESGFTDLARTFLERADERITVRTAASAEEGWETLSDTPVDCIVSDYDMGGTNGIDFLERVREAYPELPFILYTGKGSEEVAGEAISKGVTDYLQKEHGTEQYSILANRVTNAVEKRRAQRETKTHKTELQSQRDRYQSLFENNPLIIWEQDYSAAMAYLETIASEVDDVGTYLLAHPEELERLFDRVETIDVNQNALSYYGADSKAELMNNLDEVIVEDEIEVLAAQWAAFANGETEFRAETAARTLSGDRREELLEIVAPGADADDYSRVYVIGTEITEQKERERRLKRQNERLDEFTSVVSHDLRTPLHIAASRLELAAEECDSPHLESVADAHDRMERLIDDLLTFARAGSEALAYGTVELEQLLDGCWERIRTDEASLTVETDESIRADRSRLRQLLENLLLNAVEHGGSDASITVGSLADGFYIEDDGPGIPESRRNEVLEAGHSTSQEGTGFGLSIVAEVAEAHGWELHVTDGSEGGARFELTGVEFASP